MLSDEINIHNFDKIHICDLECDCVLGVYDEERGKKRPVIINLTLYYHTVQRDTNLAHTDNLDNVIDYDSLSQELCAHVEESQFYLIETLAESIARKIFTVPDIVACHIRVDKPGVPKGARSAAVEIFRRA